MEQLREEFEEKEKELLGRQRKEAEEKEKRVEIVDKGVQGSKWIWRSFEGKEEEEEGMGEGIEKEWEKELEKERQMSPEHASGRKKTYVAMPHPPL